jgi:hypothetical protein
MFGGAGDMIPEIPAKTEPIGGALRFGGGTIEMAAIVPTGTVAFLYDNARRSALGGAPAAEPKPAEPAPGSAP